MRKRGVHPGHFDQGRADNVMVPDVHHSGFEFVGDERVDGWTTWYSEYMAEEYYAERLETEHDCLSTSATLTDPAGRRIELEPGKVKVYDSSIDREGNLTGQQHYPRNPRGKK